MSPLAVDWLTKLGRKGYEARIVDVVGEVVDRRLVERIEPRLVGIENRLAGVENRLAAVENRLDVADRIAKLEAEMTLLRSNRQNLQSINLPRIPVVTSSA